MKVTESITSFLRRIDFQFWKTSGRPYWGRLDQNLVQSGKPVIVFEHPRILLEANSVEEATTFLVKESETRHLSLASVYKYDTKEWRRVAVSRSKSCPPVEAAATPLANSPLPLQSTPRPPSTVVAPAPPQ